MFRDVAGPGAGPAKAPSAFGDVRPAAGAGPEGLDAAGRKAAAAVAAERASGGGSPPGNDVQPPKDSSPKVLGGGLAWSGEGGGGGERAGPSGAAVAPCPSQCQSPRLQPPNGTRKPGRGSSSMVRGWPGGLPAAHGHMQCCWRAWLVLPNAAVLLA